MKILSSSLVTTVPMWVCAGCAVSWVCTNAHGETQLKHGRRLNSLLASMPEMLLGFLMSDSVMEKDSRMLLNAGKIRSVSKIHQLQSPCIAEHDTNGGIKQVMLDGPKR